MRKFSGDELEDVRAIYVEAAIDVVVERGWAALSVRTVGDKVRKSGTAIHRLFPGTSLKREVIEAAFVELAIALTPYADKPPPPVDRVHRIVLDYLRDHEKAAALMVQVIGQSDLTGDDHATEVAQAVVDARARTVLGVATLFAHLKGASAERQIPAAERLVRWHVLACVAIGTFGMSDPDLLALAKVA